MTKIDSNFKIKLLFIYRNAAIWSKEVEEQQEIHQRFSDHQKQFGYLPLHVFKQATNLRELLAPKTYNCEKNFDLLSNAIHEQMHRKWLTKLKDLRFVTEDTEYRRTSYQCTETINKGSDSKNECTIQVIAN